MWYTLSSILLYMLLRVQRDSLWNKQSFVASFTTSKIGIHVGHAAIISFFNLQKNIATLHEYIRQANLSKAREYLTEETAFIKDRAGRSSLHMAVLYERRFVIKYLLKSYPGLVHVKDDVSHHLCHFIKNTN